MNIKIENVDVGKLLVLMETLGSLVAADKAADHHAHTAEVVDGSGTKVTGLTGEEVLRLQLSDLRRVLNAYVLSTSKELRMLKVERAELVRTRGARIMERDQSRRHRDYLTTALKNVKAELAESKATLAKVCGPGGSWKILVDDKEQQLDAMAVELKEARDQIAKLTDAENIAGTPDSEAAGWRAAYNKSLEDINELREKLETTKQALKAELNLTMRKSDEHTAMRAEFDDIKATVERMRTELAQQEELRVGFEQRLRKLAVMIRCDEDLGSMDRVRKLRAKLSEWGMFL